MTPPEFLFFDLGNVLLNFSNQRGAEQMAAVSDIVPQLAYDTVYGSDLHVRYETGLLDAQQFYEEFCTATGSRPEFAQLEAASAAIFQINYPMLPLIAHLHVAGQRMGVLSNTCITHWEYAASGRYKILSEAFELAVLSYECKVMKPDAKIYEMATNAAGVSPERIFFTDDRPENVAGAIAFGWDAVLFTGAHDLAKELSQRGVRMNY